MSKVSPAMALNVYRRCAWMCRMPECLCPDGRHIEAWLPPDDDWAATVDHIVPRALGGTSRFTNLRAAHRKCNNDAAQADETIRALNMQNARQGTA